MRFPCGSVGFRSLARGCEVLGHRVRGQALDLGAEFAQDCCMQAERDENAAGGGKGLFAAALPDQAWNDATERRVRIERQAEVIARVRIAREGAFSGREGPREGFLAIARGANRISRGATTSSPGNLTRASYASAR